MQERLHGFAYGQLGEACMEVREQRECPVEATRGRNCA